MRIAQISYKCELCQEEFNTQECLKKHKIDTHDTASPLQCDICHSNWETDNDLRAHMKSEHEIKCPLCDAICQNNAALVSHIKGHKQSCSICESVLTQLWNLRHTRKENIHLYVI